MAAANTFNVTTSTLTGEAQGLSFSASTSPTTTEATRIILRAASRVERECAAVGIDTQAITDDTDSRYLLLEWAVICAALSMILAGRDRGNENAGKYYETQYRKAIEDVRIRPQAVDNKDTGPDLLDFVTECSPGYDNWTGSVGWKIVRGGL
jgi:hypothetical protein